MSGYQFIHYEAYARCSVKKRSLSDIAAEADRHDGNHPHVTNARPPEYLLGDSFTETADRIIQAARQSKTLHNGKARNLRKDANIAIGLVASHPLSVADLNALSPTDREQQRDAILDWADSVITFAQSEFPGLVQAACIHWDESHPHIHVLIGNPEPTDNFEVIHKGEQARKKAQGKDRSKAGRKAGNDAYKTEMRHFQDRYHQEVGMQHGQTRLGPRKRRLTREQWKCEQSQAEALLRTRETANDLHTQAMSDLARAQTDAGILLDATRTESQRERQRAGELKQAAEQALDKANEEKNQAAKARREARSASAEYKRLLTDARHTREKMTSVLGVFRSGKDLTHKLLESAEKERDELRERLESLTTRHRALQASHTQLDRLLRALTSTLQTLIQSDPKHALHGLKRIVGMLSNNHNSTETEEKLTRFRQGMPEHGHQPHQHHHNPQEPDRSPGT